MSLTVDFSVVFQIITFIVLWACLKRLVFDPFSAVLETRETRTTGTQAAATALSTDAAHTRTKYDGAIASARIELAQQSDAARKAAQEESERALAAARTEAGNTMTRRRETVAHDVDAARQTLLAQAESVASDMLGRATGREAA